MKKWLRRHAPSREALLRSRWLRPLAVILTRPGVWHLNRRSCALGVAVGMVAGLMPGPTQVLCAALVSVMMRANLPAAILTTFYTNPLTIVPLYILAFHIGAAVTGSTAQAPAIPDFDAGGGLSLYLFDLGYWVYSLGHTLLVGLGVQAALFALTGYLVVSLLWRWSVARRWRARTAAVSV